MNTHSRVLEGALNSPLPVARSDDWQSMSHTRRRDVELGITLKDGRVQVTARAVGTKNDQLAAQRVMTPFRPRSTSSLGLVRPYVPRQVVSGQIHVFFRNLRMTVLYEAG